LGNLQVFALRDNMNNVTTAEDNTAVAPFIWEKIGPDIDHSLDLDLGVSLIDNLIFSLGTKENPRSHDEDPELHPDEMESKIYVYQFDTNQSDWVRLGGEMPIIGLDSPAASMQLVLNKNTGRLLLAVGWYCCAQTFWYEPDTDQWIQFGSDLYDLEWIDSPYYRGVVLRLSLDGGTITVGAQTDAGGIGIGFLRTFSYDSASDDWIDMGMYLDGDEGSLLFGDFSLSANGKVLVTTTQKVDIVVDTSRVTGQVHTWDFIATSDGIEGEWIQRGAALEVETLESRFGYSTDSWFGYKIALSADGNRLATSAPIGLNDQSDKTGMVLVYEQD
jgi:hypothetical protein